MAKIVFQKSNEIAFKDLPKSAVIIVLGSSKDSGAPHGMVYFNKIRHMWNVMQPDGDDQFSDQKTLEELIRKHQDTCQFHTV